MKKNMVQKQTDSMKNVDFSDMLFPMIVLYASPDDFPDKIIARVWEGAKNLPTNVFCEYPDLKSGERDIMYAGFTVKIPRSPEDVVSIVCSYIK